MHTTRLPSHLDQAMYESKGMQYFNRRKIRAFTLNVFLGNLQDIQLACTEFDDPQKSMKYFRDPPDGPALQAHMEVMRHFHNFLAAAKSLIDHTRLFVEEYYSTTPIKQAYEQKVLADLAQDPLIRFVQDLRNFMLHRALPPGSIMLNARRLDDTGRSEITTAVDLDRAGLLKWKGWTEPSRKYLNQSPDQINISEICTPYGQAVVAFYEWFDGKLRKHHQDDIEEYEDLRRQYRQAEEQVKARE